MRKKCDFHVENGSRRILSKINSLYACNMKLCQVRYLKSVNIYDLKKTVEWIEQYNVTSIRQESSLCWSIFGKSQDDSYQFLYFSLYVYDMHSMSVHGKLYTWI